MARKELYFIIKVYFLSNVSTFNIIMSNEAQTESLCLIASLKPLTFLVTSQCLVSWQNKKPYAVLICVAHVLAGSV